MKHSTMTAPFAALALAITLALTSCAAPGVATVTTPVATPGAAPLSDQDAAALKTLAEVAGPTSNVDAATITGTECWLPSEHPIVDASVSATSWRVLCRAHYVQAGEQRYQDATCIGDFDSQPMLDHCYRWAYYSGAPRFGDFPAVQAP